MNARLLGWNLRHRRWRHLLNTLAMAITAGVIIVFVSVMIELLTFVNRASDRELTRGLVHTKLVIPGGAEGLPTALYSTFEDIPGAHVVQRYVLFGGRHPNGARYLIAGEEASGIELNTDFFPVEPAVFEAWKREKPLGAIVTEATARELDLTVGEVAELPSSVGPVQLKVVGISKGALVGHRIALHFEYAHQLTKNLGICQYRIFTKPADFEAVAREVVERTKNSSTPAQIVSSAHFAASWARRAGLVPALLGFLGIFLVVTTALALANNTAISIRERRTELATMRVIGYRRGTILRLILAESLVIAVVGAAIAFAVTSLWFRGGVQLTPGNAKLLSAITIGPVAASAGLLACVAIAFVGSLPSALTAVRMPLVDALRDSA
jgi:putative ABC transport system permease protein